jgi:hypothetical protein
MKSSLLILLLLVLSSTASYADRPYLHALSDLRTAREYVESGLVGEKSAALIQQINAAITDIKAAAQEDEQTIQEHPPIDATVSRFHRALDLLKSAHNDVAIEENDGPAHGLRHHALEHINRAIEVARDIISRE